MENKKDNKRRVDLIIKRYFQALTPQEVKELNTLQKKAGKPPITIYNVKRKEKKT